MLLVLGVVACRLQLCASLTKLSEKSGKAIAIPAWEGEVSEPLPFRLQR